MPTPTELVSEILQIGLAGAAIQVSSNAGACVLEAVQKMAESEVVMINLQTDDKTCISGTPMVSSSYFIVFTTVTGPCLLQENSGW
jgi:hypothetical protein